MKVQAVLLHRIDDLFVVLTLEHPFGEVVGNQAADHDHDDIKDESRDWRELAVSVQVVNVLLKEINSVLSRVGVLPRCGPIIVLTLGTVLLDGKRRGNDGTCLRASHEIKHLVDSDTLTFSLLDALIVSGNLVCALLNKVDHLCGHESRILARLQR